MVAKSTLLQPLLSPPSCRRYVVDLRLAPGADADAAAAWLHGQCAEARLQLREPGRLSFAVPQAVGARPGACSMATSTVPGLFSRQRCCSYSMSFFPWECGSRSGPDRHAAALARRPARTQLCSSRRKLICRVRKPPLVCRPARATRQARRGAQYWPKPCRQALDLAELFEAMERARGDLGIAEYSISQTSLEHVFVALAAGAQ
jgi:hypothetical protein